MAGSGDLEELLAAVGQEVADLVRAADALVRRIDPEVVRVVWPHQETVGYGIGPKKMSEHYAYLDVHARHLNLGFNRGAALTGGEGLLEGTGKSFRKVPVRTAAVLADPRIEQLLREARAERLTALGRTVPPARD
ncbi:hypothetical protein [Blastococcus sp. SYSU D00813]